jgi:multiple sugar transport system permease protein
MNKLFMLPQLVVFEKAGNGMLLNKSEKNARLIFVAPAILVLVAALSFPIFFTLGASFTDWGLSSVEAPEIVGIKNYVRFFGDKRFLNSILRTLKFAITTSFFEIFLGICLGVVFDRNFHGKNIIKTICILPFAATPVAVGIVWKLILDPTLGAANYILGYLKIPPQVFFSAETALNTLIFIEIWQGTPIVALIIMAGLSTLPTDCFESARVDGANMWQSFWKITFPLMKPTIFIAFIMRFVEVSKAFDIIYSTTQGGPVFSSETLNLYGYLVAFQYYRFGRASALIVMFTVIITIMGGLLLQLKKRMEVYL